MSPYTVFLLWASLAVVPLVLDALRWARSVKEVL